MMTDTPKGKPTAADQRWSSEQRLEALIKENLELTRQIKQSIERVNHWIVFQRIWAVFKILLIVVPLILGIIYLPALLERYLEPYREFFSGPTANQESFLESLIGNVQANN